MSEADKELTRLIDEYHGAVDNYCEAVRRLNGLPRSDFDRIYPEVEALRQVTEQRRAALEKYTRGRWS